MPDPDNQLRWLNTCCPDWEGGFSMNPCCPVSVSACVSLSKVGTLCGYSENAGYESSPPKKYKRQQRIESGSFRQNQSDCDGGTTSSSIRFIRTYSGSVAWDYDTEDCSNSYTGGLISTSTQSFICEDGEAVPSGDPADQVLYDNNNQPPSTCPTCTDIVTATSKIDRISSYGSVYNKEYLLSNEDTESAALARVDDWTQGSSCVTSDYRVNGFDVSKTTVKHEAVVTGLVIGFCYEGVIPIERALIDFDEQGNRIPPEPEDWLPFSLTAIDAFRAEQVFQTFGLGTLNVSDDDFINASFSLDPYSYPSYFPVDPETGILIDPDALVLTPFSDLPESKVYDYRVLPAVMRRVECEEE